MSGFLVTFEGLDGSGKTTHVRRLGELLEERGRRVLVTKQPGGTELGRQIRQVFLERPWEQADGAVEALLLFADRRQHLREVIEPALEGGTTVLCDRFTDSTLAYQGFGRGVSIDRLLDLDRWATATRRPDRTVLFDLSAEAAQARGQSASRSKRPQGVDRIDAEDLAFYERVRAGYLELATAEPERFRVIDSAGELDRTWAQLCHALQDLLEELRG